MAHITPKEIVTVQYLGEEPTRVRPFINGDKVDVSEGDKIDMDTRQAVAILTDEKRWKKIGETKTEESTEETPAEEAPRRGKKKK